MTQEERRSYWRTNLRLMAILLTIWALVSLGGSVLFVEQLNKVSFLDTPLGFWMAQQGSILTFVILIGIYAWRMEKLDIEYGMGEADELAHGNGPGEAH